MLRARTYLFTLSSVTLRKPYQYVSNSSDSVSAFHLWRLSLTSPPVPHAYFRLRLRLGQALAPPLCTRGLQPPPPRNLSQIWPGVAPRAYPSSSPSTPRSSSSSWSSVRRPFSYRGIAADQTFLIGKGNVVGSLALIADSFHMLKCVSFLLYVMLRRS